ncbi:Subtilase family [Musa troglodytarum]|uniref:Subtilase family n=1 Tax=Musa troglodytarum TaxID=320322 RepID=A0A9E7KNJ4_9LILI|nr:Subtilase family [Musa troglodytarum]
MPLALHLPHCLRHPVCLQSISSSRYQMMGSKLRLQLAHPPLSFYLLFLLPSIAAVEQLQTYIVRVDADARPSVFPTQSHWYETAVLAAALSTESNTSWAHGGSLIHTYSSLFYGFSARLSPSAAAALASSHGVLAVLPELVRHPDTTRSPEFLGLLSSDRTGLLAESDFGSELVIAVVDTGITPGHRSFSDRGLGPAPARWRGECVSGPGFPASACNRKLVGARYFSGGYEATSGRMNESSELRSPRDTDGHGTHTASIAAGRYVFPASTLGYARGVAAGMAPKARLAAYKVCWAAGCFDSDILAAFDAAVADGVNVVSLSVGGVVVPYYLDAIAVGAFAAAEAGIFVSASAGNGGPGELTVTNVAPWVATVGAGSMDRDFPAYVKLGNGRVRTGVSVYGGPALSAGRLYPIVYAGAAQGAGDGYSSSLCLEGSLNRDTVKGKIVLCDRGVNSRAAKGEVVRKAGAVGMILANGIFDGEGLVADCHVLPAAAVGAVAGDEIRKYIAAATLKSPATATILFRGTRLGVRPAPVVASFSARGPSPQSPEILKPDVIAPGLNILAAWPDNVGPAGIPSDQRKTEFNILSGTSMACPHVSGLAALLKAAHPDWSPAAIKSALMTTSYVKDNRGTRMLDESTGNSSDVFDYGAGHVHPQRAIDPGLVYDLTATDYVNFLCNLNYTQQNIKAITRRPADCRGARKAGHAGNLNYPSFSAVFVQDGAKRRMSTHFIRTVTNVGNGAAVYRAEVRAPEGSRVTVEPTELAFRRPGQKLSFLVRVKAATAEKLAPGSSKARSGALTWSDGKHSVNSPIVVTVQAPVS